MNGQDAQAIKLKFIDLIVNLPSDERLVQLYQAAQQILARPHAASAPYGAIRLRQGVSKDQVFAEQGHKSPSWETHRALLGDFPWQRSSEELIGFLD